MSKTTKARSAGHCRTPDIQQRARSLKLATGNRINHKADLGLEYATRYALEQNFGLIAGTNALQGVLWNAAPTLR
jgi:hypothetical protein